MAWYTDTVEKVHLVSHSGHFSTSSTSGIGALQKECWRTRSEHILLWPAFWAIFENSTAEPRVTSLVVAVGRRPPGLELRMRSAHQVSSPIF